MNFDSRIPNEYICGSELRFAKFFELTIINIPLTSISPATPIIIYVTDKINLIYCFDLKIWLIKKTIIIEHNNKIDP